MKSYLLVLCLCISAVAGRPLLYRRAGDDTTPVLGLGSYVGVKAKVYEGTNKINSKGPPHPGVVIGKDQDRLKVAMISNKHPGNPPQVPIAQFHPNGGLQGNINLHAKAVNRDQVKFPWKGAAGPMPLDSVAQLSQFVDSPHSVPNSLRPPPPPVAAGGHNPPHSHSHPLPPRPATHPSRVQVSGSRPYPPSTSRHPVVGPSSRHPPPTNGPYHNSATHSSRPPLYYNASPHTNPPPHYNPPPHGQPYNNAPHNSAYRPHPMSAHPQAPHGSGSGGGHGQPHQYRSQY